MRFYTDGTEAVRIDSSQRVGIGTNSVNGFTHINGRMDLESPSVPSILAISDSGDATKNLRLGYEPTWDVGCISASDHGAGWKDIVIAPHAGNVGIGTTSPHQALSVKGTIVTYNSSYIQVAGMTNSSNAGRLYANNAGGVTNVLLDSNGDSYLNGGNVGIGTTNPDTLLTVDKNDTVGPTIGLYNSEYDSWINAWGSTASAGRRSRFEINASNTDFAVAANNIYFQIGTAGDSYEKMRITSAGNVGIGLTDPDTLLEVAGVIKSSSTSRIQADTYNNSANSANIIYRSSSKTIVGNNASALVVMDGGNVGIGTTDPVVLLHVDGSSPKIRLRDNDAAGTPLAHIDASDGALKLQADSSDETADSFLTLEVDGGERVRVTSVGKVGIGTTDPLGTTHIYTADAGGAIVTNASHDDLIIENNGNCGIQLSSPASSYQYLAFGDTASANAGYVRYYHSDDSMVLRAGANDTVTIKGDDVRIGTNTNFPAGTVAGGKLDVRGDSDGQLLFDTDGGSSDIKSSYNLELWADYDNNNSAGYSNIYFKTDGDNTRMTIDNNGKVGIGNTQPADTLQVAGQVRIDGSTTDGLTVTSSSGASQGLLIYNNSSTDTASIINYYDGPLVLGQNNTEVMRLHSNGNVGIGVTNPSETLEVNPDNDSSAILGRAHVGYVGFSDYAGFSHVDKNSVGNFAFMQAPNGTTFVNCSSSQEIRFQSNNYTLAKFDGSNGDFSIATDALYVDASAHSVGIGTSSPSYELHVEGEILAESNMLLGGDGTYGSTYGAIGIGTTNLTNGHHRIFAKSSDHMYFAAATSKGFRFRPNGGATSASAGVTIASDGDVGIGTTGPANKLDIYGSLAVGASFVGVSAPSDGAIFNGNVGIGTSSVSNKLDVAGGIAIGSSYAGVSAPSNGAIIEGYVGIGTSSNSYYPLYVNGTLYATSKYFIIDHPVPEKKAQHKKLLHACIEGPEVAVYFRGKNDLNIIKMPDYWDSLVHIDSMTVELTPIGANQDIYVDSIADNGDVTIGANTDAPLNYFYVVYGERKDVDKLEPEIVDPEYAD